MDPRFPSGNKTPVFYKQRKSFLKIRALAILSTGPLERAPSSATSEGDGDKRMHEPHLGLCVN